jgi:LSD1 subclass zinc finger protein
MWRTCEHCTNTVKRKRSQRTERRFFCSVTCRAESRKRTCPCGAEFIARSDRAETQRYCSARCAKAGNGLKRRRPRATIICRGCREPFEVLAGSSRKSCSVPCAVQVAKSSPRRAPSQRPARKPGRIAMELGAWTNERHPFK